MSHRIIDLNEDLRRLRDEGYNVDIHAAHLVVRDVPYVNARREVLCDGILACSLNLSGDIVNAPNDHTMKFCGQTPCTSDGRTYDALRPAPEVTQISQRLTTQFTFSSKPFINGEYRQYYSYHEKIKTYAAHLCVQANIIDPDATPRTFRVVEPEDDDSPFNYLDTASARAEINAATAKLAADKVAIVGLGGTGSYVLDLLAKAPIKEIHLFDSDKFASHNAFRAPGAASKDDLHKQMFKVEYLHGIYSRLHKRLALHAEDIDASNVDQLRVMTHVFLCLDASPSKKLIVDKLEEYGVPFTEVGIGVYAKNDSLGGKVQVTSSGPDGREAARARMSFAAGEGNDDYDRNIQIADLNALNAALAVIRWKKSRGFYLDMKHERFSSYTIASNLLLSEDIHDPIGVDQA